MHKIAIVGSGIAGMSCAYFLRNDYDITFYEKNDYIGGHTNTRIAYENGKEVPIDTGFMVFNNHTYPNLIKLFTELEIESYPTNMSFGVQQTRHNIEMAFSNLKTLFAQKRNLLNPKFLRMIRDILRFFNECQKVHNNPEFENKTLEEFILEHRYGREFSEWFLLPMIAAIWSTPSTRMLEYPVQSLFHFMQNHGLLGIGTQFQWRTVTGGSMTYRDKILDKVRPTVFKDRKVVGVEKADDGVRVSDSSGEISFYDKVIIASHADQALRLLKKPTSEEERLLGSFSYNINSACLHSDEKVMPKAKNAWASWNYKVDLIDNRELGSTHYWMNNLQDLESIQNYFVSIDYKGMINPEKIIWQTTYEHPRFDTKAIIAQQELPILNKTGPIYFCGSYFRNGFHEDALNAGIQVSQNILGKTNVWQH